MISLDFSISQTQENEWDLNDEIKLPVDEKNNKNWKVETENHWNCIS